MNPTQRVVLLIVSVILGAIYGYLAGVVGKGRRPYGLAGDLLIGIACQSIVSITLFWLVPKMGFTAPIWRWLSALGDTSIVTIFILWLARRIQEGYPRSFGEPVSPYHTTKEQRNGWRCPG